MKKVITITIFFTPIFIPNLRPTPIGVRIGRHGNEVELGAPLEGNALSFPLALSVFVVKNVSKGMRKTGNIKFFYVAPFDTFYYVTLRRTLRASGLNNQTFNFRSNNYCAPCLTKSIHFLSRLNKQRYHY